MAEGWCRYFWIEKYDCYSAGTQKHGLNPRAVLSMKNAGLDISSHFSKTVDELPIKDFDYVVTVCDSAKEACPYFPSGKIIHIGFQDPPTLTKNMTNEEEILKIYDRVRDEIRQEIVNLTYLLDKNS